MRIEESFRRYEIQKRLSERLNIRLTDFLKSFPPNSQYAKVLTNDVLAEDLLKEVLRKETFIYHPPWEDEKIFIIYKGEVFNYSEEIKKIITGALKHFGISRGRNRINEVYYHIHLNTGILKEQLEILEKYAITKNYYVLDREKGEMLKITYQNIKFFFSLFRKELGYNERILQELKILDQWLGAGEIQEDEDLSGVLEANELWENLTSLLPWPIRLPVEYDPEAKAPRWEQFLNEVVDKKYHTSIKRFVGYALYPDILSNLKSVSVLLGEGSNGKSVFIRAIESIFGRENVSHVNLQDLSRRFDKASLEKKLLNIAGDLPRDGIRSTGEFKQITGGDTVKVEKKYKDPYDAIIYAKHIFSANELPPTSDKTYAFYRRWMIFIFPHTFKEDEADPRLLEKLLNELPGIFNWVLEGFKELKENGFTGFGYPHTIEEVADMYELASNSLARFINEECEEAPGEIITFTEFYKLYYAYCGEHNLTPKADSLVGREIKTLAPYVIRDKKKIQGEKKRVLLNIRVNYIPVAKRKNILAEAEKRGMMLSDFEEEEDPNKEDGGDLDNTPILVRVKESFNVAWINGDIEGKEGEIKKIPWDVARILMKNGKVEPYGDDNT